jgi:hypothetical protein
MPETTRRINDIISAGEKVSDALRLQGKYFGSMSFVLKFMLVMTPGASELVAALHFSLRGSYKCAFFLTQNLSGSRPGRPCFATRGQSKFPSALVLHHAVNMSAQGTVGPCCCPGYLLFSSLFSLFRIVRQLKLFLIS